MHVQKVDAVQPQGPRPIALVCTCERPVLRERAERKGAAMTFCERCGLPAPLRFR